MISRATVGKHGGFSWILHYTLYWFLAKINGLKPEKLKKELKSAWLIRLKATQFRPQWMR